LEALYWVGAACVAYPYAVYPALLALRARLRPRPVRRARPGSVPPTVSVVIAAHNEEAAVARRIAEFTGRIAEWGLTGEVVIVSDGSTDATAAVARAFEGGPVPVTVLEGRENAGKAAALSAGCEGAGHEVIVLADARQTWAADALVRLLENFDDPEVGAVSGELFVESAPGVMAGVGLYWRYEKALRRMESLAHSTVGVTGSISAVRRSLFRPVPSGTLLDDVYWPLVVAMQGYRVVFDGRARAFDRLPERVGAEFRRKVRTLAGNFQLVARLPGALSPRGNPVWFALVSHKLMRLAVPWALLATAALAAARGGPVYHGLLAAQAGLTLAGVAGLVPEVARRSRVASASASFLVLNAAAWVAFWVWATGRSSRSWTKTVYRTSAPAPSAVPAGSTAPAPAPAFEGAAR
jgi:cellulose synthase/poly-beta-1,6-N-acetylglucosamine synthase-like glycosyltransferase